MPLVSSSIANLVNGVSQQPYTLRLASQAEVQENGLSTVAQGLKKRPPIRHIKRISDPISGGAYTHTINRDKTERYHVILSQNDLKVFAEDGTERVVNFPEGKAYLNCSIPSRTFRAVTVADYTFIVNRDITVVPSAAISPVRPFEAILVVKSGIYGKPYKVFVNGTQQATFTTPNGATAADMPMIATDYIAAQLVGQLVDNLVPLGYTATRNGSVIYLSKATDFILSTSDGYNDTALVGIKAQLQRFSDLPPNAYTQDFTVEIVGDKTSSFDNYWVKFDKANNGTGVWRETIKPGISLGFNPASMPWSLVRESNGTFTFKTISWKGRVVGDEDSAPHPSFVGRFIQDVFFYRNRLGFIADESVVFSEAGEFFNFYPSTVTDLVDSDRIDVSVSHTKVSNLVAAVPFSKQLLLFSSQTQFAVESGELLTPRTISIKPTTEFECDPEVHPEGIGRVVYFAVPKGGFSGIREYFVDSDTGSNDAAEVTSHVPQYIPKNISKMAVALNEDILCAISKEEKNVIYVYKFYWNSNEKLQSSWSRWVLSPEDNILSIDFLESVLSLVIERPSGVFLETLDVSDNVDLSKEPFLVHLDRKVLVAKEDLTFANGVTTIPTASFGYTPDVGSYLAVGAMGGGSRTGQVVDITWDGVKATIPGNFTASDIVVGRTYRFTYRFSKILPKSRSGQGGEKSDNVALLQLRNLQVNYAETGYFQAQVTPQGRDTYTYKFTGKVLGVPSSTIGAINLATGSYRFPVMSQNTTVDIELQSDSPLPCSFLSVDWEGYYAKRSQGI